MSELDHIIRKARDAGPEWLALIPTAERTLRDEDEA